MFLQKLNEVLASEKSFLSDRLSASGFALSAVINIIHWLALYSKIRLSDERILLHYNVIFGPDWINQSFYVYLIPFLALIILMVNLRVASQFYKRERLSGYFLSIATVGVQLIFLIASFVLINVNG